MNDSNEEITNLEEALAESPGNATLRRQLGEVLIKIGNFSRAEEELKRALQYRSNDTRINIALAKCYQAQGKNGAAIILLESLVEKEDASAEAKALYRSLTVEEESGENSENKNKEDMEPEKIKVTSINESEIVEEIDIEKPKMNFESVGGMERVKEEVRMKIILPMTNKDLYKAYGKKAGGGILLYGPPGCGKTHLARATAGEINAKFISIGLNDILDMYLGQSEQKLHQLFEHARYNKPCVLFFDEVDALGANRGDLRKQAGRTIVNQFLMELDGISDNNQDVLILAATNAPWYLDQAFRRPGRFDRIIFVEPPDQKAGIEILKIMLKEKPTEKIDYEKIANKLKDYSGADIKALIDSAVEEKIREAMKTGKPLPIKTSDLLNNLRQIKSSTKEWFTTAKNYAVYANESGLYDDILKYMGLK